jgi:hypothetical protein
METRPREVELVVNRLPGAVAWTSTGARETASQRVKITVAPDSVQKVRLFVTAPEDGPARTDFEIAAVALTGNERGDSDSVRFERPEAGQ